MPASPNSLRFARWLTSTVMPSRQNSSSRAAAFFTAIPRPRARVDAESSGAAASRSTAAAAREVRRRPATALRAAIQDSSSSSSSCSGSVRNRAVDDERRC